MTERNIKTNRLVHEKSPYLLQHAYNPVDWFPWGEEAFQKAKAEDKPIFLSIGYSTCHWCHVMERESFEDEEVAEVLNENFIAIKVDREERPDIDSIYMTFCQALTGHGGWPLTVFLTPDKKPFFAGTYFPKRSRMGMPGLIDILEKIKEMWVRDKKTLLASSEEIYHHLQTHFFIGEAGELTEKTVANAYNSLKNSFDSKYGGFGTAPKFPLPHNLMFLLRYFKLKNTQEALHMVEKTLKSMYKGGTYDHIGYGFSRYATDVQWLVPHFEKMLYDNALLAIVYLEAYQVFGEEFYAKVAREIFTYILRDMTFSGGGFYSAEDADSEGVEGKFYVWTPEEINQVLGEEEGSKFCRLYDITTQGNFAGKSIPNLLKTGLGDVDNKDVEKMKEKLFLEREKRVHPYKDDKILTSWNGLMVAALCLGARVLNNEEYAKAAVKAVEFIFANLYQEGRLLARYRDGEAKYLGYVDDYAFLIWGLLELYETTYETDYLAKALQLNKEMLEYFWDDQEGGLYLYGKDSEELIARPKEVYDGALPSGNSVAVLNFLRLARLTGDIELEEKAVQAFNTFGGTVNKNPGAYTFFISAFLFNLAEKQEVVFVGSKDTQETYYFQAVLAKRFEPFTVSLLYDPEKDQELVKLVPFIKEHKQIENKPTVYLCKNFSCQAPVNELTQFEKMMAD